MLPNDSDRGIFSPPQNLVTRRELNPARLHGVGREFDNVSRAYINLQLFGKILIPRGFFQLGDKGDDEGIVNSGGYLGDLELKLNSNRGPLAVVGGADLSQTVGHGGGLGPACTESSLLLLGWHPRENLEDITVPGEHVGLGLRMSKIGSGFTPGQHWMSSIAEGLLTEHLLELRILIKRWIVLRLIFTLQSFS